MADDTITKAKKYLQKRLQNYVAPLKKEPDYPTPFTQRRAGQTGVRELSISGEEGKSNEPAYGSYEHNSPAKPL